MIKRLNLITNVHHFFILHRFANPLVVRSTLFVTEQVDMTWYEIDLRKKKNLVKSAFYEVN